MKVGITVECTVCHQRKQPRGRSAPLDMYLCDWECPGYNLDPQPGTLWPGETEKDFGYSIGPHGWREEPDNKRLADQLGDATAAGLEGVD